MSRQLTQYHIAILNFLAENNYGKQRTDKIFKEFESNLLDHEQINGLLEDLEQLGYIKPIEIDEQRVQLLEEMTGESVSSKGYKITQLGKAKVGNSHSPVAVYSNISNSNIAHQSPHATQSIRISEQPEDIQKKFAELQDAIAKKDSSAMKKAFGYIADKSVDVAIAIMTGAILL